LRIFIQEFIKNKGIEKLALAFSDSSNDLKDKICNNLSKNASRQFIETLKTNLESPVEMTMVKRDCLNTLFNLYSKKRISLPVNLKRLYTLLKRKEDKRISIETELILKSHLFDKIIGELNNIQIQLLLRKTDRRVITRVIHNINEEVQNKIFQNMSKNSREIILQDYHYWLKENRNPALRMIKIGEARKKLMENSLQITGNLSTKVVLDYYITIHRLYTTGEFDKTVEMCEKAISFQKRAGFEIHSMFYGIPAWIYAFQGKNLDKSSKLAFKALNLSRTDSEKCFHLDTIGWIFYKKGNLNEAINRLKEAKKYCKNEKYVEEHLKIVQPC